MCMFEVIEVSPGNLDSSCALSSLTFCMIYSAYKLNKQGNNIQPWCTSFPIWKESVVPCPVLTVASWPIYRFLKRQVRWSGIRISFRIFHSLLWSTPVKGFGIVNKEEIDVFLELSITYFFQLRTTSDTGFISNSQVSDLFLNNLCLVYKKTW